MVNNEVLVKYIRSGRSKTWSPTDWPDGVLELTDQIKEALRGFPGIGLTDISVLDRPVIVGERVFLIPELDGNEPGSDVAPMLVTYLSPGRLRVDGIGRGDCFRWDPDRRVRWGTEHLWGLPDYHMILRLDSVPKPDGGPMYYYFEKSLRDYRW